MARVTIEDCLKEMSNRFALVHMAGQRVRQLRRGATPRTTRKNKDVVIALREIAAGRVTIMPVEGDEAEANDRS